MDSLLLHGELAQRVLSHAAVSARHAQRTATLTGHAGESLSAAEVIHGHLFKVHPPCPHPLLPLQYGGCYKDIKGK